MEISQSEAGAACEILFFCIERSLLLIVVSRRVVQREAIFPDPQMSLTFGNFFFSEKRHSIFQKCVNWLASS